MPATGTGDMVRAEDAKLIGVCAPRRDAPLSGCGEARLMVREGLLERVMLECLLPID